MCLRGKMKCNSTVSLLGYVLFSVHIIPEFIQGASLSRIKKKIAPPST
jgi:hypothetical protein